MRLNQHLQLHGEQVVLVPYTTQLVQRYHAWMQSEELREATGSELLTLDEELEMCSSWREDTDKLTFIVLDKAAAQAGSPLSDAAACGDVNCFLNAEPGEAEVSVMIAEPESRRRGCAAESVRLLQAYAAGALGVRLFRAKIGQDNTASVGLFLKLGYAVVSSSEVFREDTYELLLPQEQACEAYARLRIVTLSH